MARLLPDGELDRSFGGGRPGEPGFTVTNFGPAVRPVAVAVDSRGRFVVAGGPPVGDPESVFGVARFLPSGKLDRTFGRNGKLVEALGYNGGGATGVVTEGDGRVIVAPR